MKPAPFAYHCPETLEELLELTAEHGESGRVLAGGQSLMPLLNARRVRARHVIDLNAVRILDDIQVSDTTLVIGALVRQAQALAAAEVTDAAPLVGDALTHVASATVRNRGTVGGSMAFAHPAGQLSAAALATGGEVIARHAEGERRISIETLFVGPFATALRPGEVITQLRLTRWSRVAGHSFLEVSRMRWPVVSAAALVELDGDVVSRCAVALAGVGAIPGRETGVERSLTGVIPTDRAVADAADAVSGDRELRDDAQGTAAYRLHVARVLTRRALAQAAARAARTAA